MQTIKCWNLLVEHSKQENRNAIDTFDDAPEKVVFKYFVIFLQEGYEGWWKLVHYLNNGLIWPFLQKYLGYFDLKLLLQSYSGDQQRLFWKT